MSASRGGGTLETTQRKGRRRALALSLALVLLVSFAVAGAATPLFFAVACSAPIAAATLQRPPEQVLHGRAAAVK